MTAIPNLEREAYDKEPRESWTKLRRLDKSPRHYQHGPDEETTAQKFGTLIHLATLEPARFAREVVVWGQEPDQKVRNGKRWEQFKSLAEHDGKTIATVAEIEAAQEISSSVHADPFAGPLLSGGEAELSLLWEHEGIKLKSRLDYVRAGALVDLKKVQDASPGGFSKSIWTYRLDGQAAMYQHAYAAVTGEWRPFYWIAVEEAAPHVVQVYRATPDMLEAGWRYCLELMERLRFCRTTESWPGYANGILEAEYPVWARVDGDGY